MSEVKHTPFSAIDTLRDKKTYAPSEPELFKQFNPFLTNRAMSLSPDTILYANEMNQCHWLDARLQYDYYFHFLRKSKRSFAKWPKKRVDDADVEVVAEAYKYSADRAREALALLTQEQVAILKKQQERGGPDERRVSKPRSRGRATD